MSANKVGIFLLANVFFVSGLMAASLPDEASLDVPCLRKYYAMSGVGQFLTGKREDGLTGFVSLYLVPDFVREEQDQWEYVQLEHGGIFCTHPGLGKALASVSPVADSLHKPHALWRKKGDSRIYIYDFDQSKKILAWSQIYDEETNDEIWVDHLNQVVWGDRVYMRETDSSSQIVVDVPFLATFEESLKMAPFYESAGIPAGNFQMPRFVDYDLSIAAGLLQLAPGMFPSDPFKSEYRQSHRNFYWFAPIHADDRVMHRVAGSTGLYDYSFSALRPSGSMNYIRYVVRGAEFQKLQEQGILPASDY